MSICVAFLNILLQKSLKEIYLSVNVNINKTALFA